MTPFVNGLHYWILPRNRNTRHRGWRVARYEGGQFFLTTLDRSCATENIVAWSGPIASPTEEQTHRIDDETVSQPTKENIMHKIIEAATVQFHKDNGPLLFDRAGDVIAGPLSEAIEQAIESQLVGLSGIFNVASGDAINPATGGEEDAGQKSITVNDNRPVNGSIEFAREFELAKLQQGFDFKDGDKVTLLIVPADGQPEEDGNK